MNQVYASGQNDLPVKPSDGPISYPVGSPNYVQQSYGSGSYLPSYYPTLGISSDPFPVQTLDYRPTETTGYTPMVVGSVPEPASIVTLLTGVLLVGLAFMGSRSRREGRASRNRAVQADCQISGNGTIEERYRDAMDAAYQAYHECL